VVGVGKGRGAPKGRDAVAAGRNAHEEFWKEGVSRLAEKRGPKGKKTLQCWGIKPKEAMQERGGTYEGESWLEGTKGWGEMPREIERVNVKRRKKW